jgi:hypothetical protein
MRYIRYYVWIFIWLVNSEILKDWNLYEDDMRRINTIEMDALRWSAKISKLDRKTNEYMRGKMDVQDTILDDNLKTTHLVWTCWENGPNAVAKKHDQLDTLRKEKNKVIAEEPGKMGYIQPWVRGLRMGEWNNQRQWKASSNVLKLCNIHILISNPYREGVMLHL